MTVVDVHQHLWPEPLLAALARRTDPPCLVRHREGWAVRVPGEPDSPMDPADHDPALRAALLEAQGIHLALVAPSSPLGVEALPRAEAEPLIAAYHEGVAALPESFGAWAAVALDDPSPEDLADRLDDGFAGAAIAADALGDPVGVAALGPVLETLERRGAPLLVHPGPSPATLGSAGDGRLPAWWPAMTRYVASMIAAWHGFAAFGRPAHPRLRACFVMLAGLAPLHRERLVARGGRQTGDPRAFVDVSSYGPRAVDAAIRELGVDSLVFGSDIPVVIPRPLGLGDAVDLALRERNPARLLTPTPTEVPA